MDNKFIKDSSVFFITTIITSGLGFITLPIYTRHLSPADYGVLAMFLLFGSVIVNLVSVGLMTSSYRYYFEYKNEQFSAIYKWSGEKNKGILIDFIRFCIGGEFDIL